MEKNEDKQRTTVTINGQHYTIVSAENRDHVKEVARVVDDQMQEVRKRNPYLDTTKLAVLAALNTADEYVKLKRKYEGDTNG
ncbi:cell division protein ZapA [Shouchella shacheensis]|uniref:cell division protein ZapA n=1 Tax=Shouchella shacheensis TaxID=1649580 RepID=UPI00074031E3|nr:cell division protein ZapA [Shouchella shacheensis]